MNYVKKILLVKLMIALFIFAIIVGCGTGTDSIPKEPVIEITGKPLGFGESYGRECGSFSILFEVNGKKILGYTPVTTYYSVIDTKINAMAQSLAMAKMNDRNDGQITVKGIYDKENKFTIFELYAYGYIIKWK